MSELGTLDLEAAGLSIDQMAIYNPDGLAIVDGICKLEGCTGSFVSDQGLILTNHHCAYGAIRNASTFPPLPPPKSFPRWDPRFVSPRATGTCRPKCSPPLPTG